MFDKLLFTMFVSRHRGWERNWHRIPFVSLFERVKQLLCVRERHCVHPGDRCIISLFTEGLSWSWYSARQRPLKTPLFLSTGPLLSLSVGGGEEGASYVQCPEEDGGTWERNTQDPAQSFATHPLWKCRYHLHLVFNLPSILFSLSIIDKTGMRSLTSTASIMYTFNKLSSRSFQNMQQGKLKTLCCACVETPSFPKVGRSVSLLTAGWSLSPLQHRCCHGEGRPHKYPQVLHTNTIAQTNPSVHVSVCKHASLYCSHNPNVCAHAPHAQTDISFTQTLSVSDFLALHSERHAAHDTLKAPAR